VLVSVINERDDGLAIEIIEPASPERKTVTGKIAHRRANRSCRQTTVHGVLVGRRNIDKVVARVNARGCR